MLQNFTWLINTNQCNRKELTKKDKVKMAKYFGMVYYICGNFQVKVMFGFRHSEVTI